MHCQCLILVKDEPNVKKAWNLGIRALQGDSFFKDDDNIYLRQYEIYEAGIPAIPQNPLEYEPYGFQKIGVTPHDWHKDNEHQPPQTYLTLPQSRKAKDADEAFFETLKERLDFFDGDNYSCAIIDRKEVEADPEVVIFNPEEADFIGEIRKAGPNDWIFSVCYHGI